MAENIGLDFAARHGPQAAHRARACSKGIESYLFKKNKITLFKGQGRLEGAAHGRGEGREGGETTRRRRRT